MKTSAWNAELLPGRVPFCPSVCHRTWLRGLAQGAIGERISTTLMTAQTNQPVAKTHACHSSCFTWFQKAVVVHLVSLKTVELIQANIGSSQILPRLPQLCNAGFQSMKHNHFTTCMHGLLGLLRCILTGAALVPLCKAPGGGTTDRSGPGQGLVRPACSHSFELVELTCFRILRLRDRVGSCAKMETRFKEEVS